METPAEQHYCVRCNSNVDVTKFYSQSELTLFNFYGFCLDCQRIVFEEKD